MRAGLVGVGVMGAHMARNLAEAGHAVTVYDLDAATAARVAEAIGGTAAPSLSALAAASDIVITMLPNGEAVRDAVKGGLAEGLAPGALLIDTSSAEPWLTKETAAALAGRGVAMVDAPVSGAMEGARDATLVFMCGGADADLARARPLLEAMGREIHHLGPVGSGHMMKTVNNLATALNFLGTCEAMLIGKAAGLSPKAMLDVINASTGQSFVTSQKMGPHVLSRGFTDPFKLSLMVKDMRIALQLAEENGLSPKFSKEGLAMWRAADAALGEGASVTAIARWCEGEMGMELTED
jgi:3-hydroxyisobutyrate dehydrogenase-like beta-hydroxyacid dehydrogenase